MLKQVCQAAMDLIKVLNQKPSITQNFLTFEHTEHVALQKLAEIFQNKFSDIKLTSQPTDIPTLTAPTDTPVSALRVEAETVPAPRVNASPTQPT